MKAKRSSVKILQLPPEFWEVVDRLHSTPDGKAWLRLFKIFEDTSCDPLIAASQDVSGFVALMTEIVGDNISGTATEAFKRLDSVLPTAEAKRATSQKLSVAASGFRKLTEKQRLSAKKQYDERIRNGQGYGALKALSAHWGVSPKTMAGIVNPALSRKIGSS